MNWRFWRRKHEKNEDEEEKPQTRRALVEWGKVRKE